MLHLFLWRDLYPQLAAVFVEDDLTDQSRMVLAQHRAVEHVIFLIIEWIKLRLSRQHLDMAGGAGATAPTECAQLTLIGLS
jgi:hypothetical protein